MAEPRGGVSYRGPALGIAAILAVALIVMSLLWIASEMHLRACVEKAEARFPAVPVSSFSGPETGALKVSFVKERQEAVDECGRI